MASASTVNAADTADRALDGREDTWWLCSSEDETPVLRIEFGDPINARGVRISPADGRVAGIGRFDAPLELAITVDGRREPWVVAAPDDPLAPIELDFGKRRKLRRIEIAITRRAVAETAPGLAGFGEVHPCCLGPRIRTWHGTASASRAGRKSGIRGQKSGALPFLDSLRANLPCTSGS